MEIKEISTVTYPLFDGVAPFCLSASNRQEFCICAKQSAQVLNLNYDTVDSDCFKFLLSVCNVPQLIPTKNLVGSAKTLFNNSKDIYKQELCIDPILLPEISPSAPNICFISIKFAPGPDDPHQFYSSYLAGLTNYGGLEIKIKRLDDRHWNIIIADLSALWLKQCKLEQLQLPNSDLNKFKDFYEMVHNVQITAFDWNNIIINNMFQIVCLTASGKLIIFAIPSQYQEVTIESVDIQYTDTLKQIKVNTIKWFTFRDENNKLNSYLCTGDVMGNIILYQIDYDESEFAVCGVTKKLELWSYDDKLRVGDIHIEYDTNFNYIVVTVCKGSNIIVFLVNDQYHDKAIAIINHVDHFFITGKYGT